MCLALPMRILSINPANRADAELDGFIMNIGIDLVPDVSIGQHVLVHAGFALEIIDHDAAKHLTKDLRSLANTACNTTFNAAI